MTTLRSLLVHLDAHAASSARLQIALRLAKEHDCHLVGLAPTGVLDLPAVPGAAAALADLATRAWDALRDEAEQAAARFRQLCEAAGLKSFEAVVDEAETIPSLLRHARCSDLTLLTQADPNAPDRRAMQASVESVVLHSARPTLVVPYAGRFPGRFDNVMVAWDDSREATRALADALPLLCRARTVQVVAWNEARAGTGESLQPRLESLRRWLLWHGVTAEVHVETTRIPIAEAMLSRAADGDAELVVMGAYGHARLAEFVLGGATRGLLAAMTLPVLMSH